MLKTIQCIVDPALPLYSNLANVSAVLNTMEKINWCGFYLARDRVLYVGPFQGEVACAKIPFGKGVCGKAAEEKRTILVPDVRLFAGHIACSARSRSEIVVPILKGGEVVAEIDIDAPILRRFGPPEQQMLEEIASFLSELF